MNEDKNSLTQVRLDRITSDAAVLLEKIATDEDWYTTLARGRQEYGASFAAYLLNPLATACNVDQVFGLYNEAHVLSARDEKSAIEMLVHLNGWEEIRDSASRQLGVEGLLTWDESDLRSVLMDRYSFIQTNDGCFVFDLDVIRPDHF